MILKLQRTLFPPAAESVLVYSEDRAVHEEYKGRAALDICAAYGLERGGKVFVHGRLDDKGVLFFGNTARNCEW